jgi:uncharacterized iron-regulated membrane protein
MRNWKKLHGYIALIITLPLIVTALTGVILQLRDQFEFIQPSPIKTELAPNKKLLTFEAIQEKHPDLDQVIYKPSKGTMVVRFKDGLETHLHPQTGEALKTAMRRTNFLIDLHQGSWMGKFGQYIIHFSTGLGLCFLIVSGLIIYPFKRKKI